MPICDKFKCIFVHVPRTGGQTIWRLLDFPKVTEALFGFREGLELTHLTASQISLRRPREFGSYLKFAMVRHPLDRLVSEYCFGIQTGYFPYLRDHQRTCSFKVFVQLVSRLLKQRTLQQSVMCHLYPQTDFLYGDGERLVNYVGRYESFETHIKTLCDWLSIPVPDVIPKTNNTVHHDWRSYYDPESEKLAREMYRNDFFWLEYE